MIKYCTKLFIYTRLFYITCIALIYNTTFIKKYDLSPEIITSPYLDSNSNNNNTNTSSFAVSFSEKTVLNFLSHFSSYDAIQFIHVAKDSYTADSNFAFFPFFPLLINKLSTILKLLITPLHFQYDVTFLLISGFLISNTFCYVNAVLLYSLIYTISNDKLKSKICVLLFLINPGSMFYMSIYAENLCMTMSMLFICFLISSAEGTMTNFIPLCVLLIGLIATRSNSLFMCSYFVIPCMSVLFTGKTKIVDMFDINSFKYNCSQFFTLIKQKIEFIGKYVILCIHAYLVFLYMTKFHPKHEICISIKKGMNIHNSKYSLFENYCRSQKTHNYTLSTNSTKVNNIYSYIQNEYWNVGFLKQFSIDTLDRVLLCIPMNIVAVYVLYKGLCYFDFVTLIRKFHFVKFLLNKRTYKQTHHKHTHSHHNEAEKEQRAMLMNDIKLNTFILGAEINLLFMEIVLIFMAHPQINNRLLAGCPIIYYFISDDVIDFIKNGQHSKRGLLILVFFVSFSILSCIMQVGCYGFA